MMKYPDISDLTVYCSSVFSDKLAALEKGQLTDCAFLVGKCGEKLVMMHAFKSDLIVSSGVFREMLIGTNDETKPIRIKEVQPEDFQNLLLYLHVCAIRKSLTLTEFVELGVLAHTYMVPSLEGMCASAIRQMLTPSQIWQTLNRVVHAPKLANACDWVLKSMTLQCLEENEGMFFEVTKESLVYFLKMDELSVSENFLVDKCIKLDLHKAKTEENWMRVALPHLRLLTMEKDEMEKLGKYLSLDEQRALGQKMLFKVCCNWPNSISSDEKPRNNLADISLPMDEKSAHRRDKLDHDYSKRKRSN